MAEETGSIDCPDCQLQMLQNQNHEVPPTSCTLQQQPHPSLGPTPEVVSRTAPLSLLTKPPLFSQEVSSQSHFQFSNIPPTDARPSSNCLSIYSYGTGEIGGGTFPTSMSSMSVASSGASTSTVAVSLHSTSLPLANPSVVPSQGCELNYTSTGTPIEPCDYNGYCSTCAVLELPTNDTYYRKTNSRPHVFPPIFYSQGPSSVIPCFSPIPDCTPWTNDYNNPYAYPPPYSQSASSVSVSASMDYYATSGSINPSSFENLVPGNSTTSMLQSTYSTNTCSSIYNNTSSRNNENSATDTTYNTVERRDSKRSCSFPERISVTATASISSSTIYETDSSCDSDNGSSITSEDQELELISVVEDDDDETESTKAGRPGGKCLICQNPIEITDCSSPQLAKILENIEEDITAEDLDITVSSGDIEIGGMEDEVKDFQNLKKRNVSGTSHGILSISRLATLLGVSSKSLFGEENVLVENDVACLCFRCGKLASLADSLERQLGSAIQTLQQQIMSSHSSHDFPTPISHLRPTRDECEPNSSQIVKESKAIQTDFEERPKLVQNSTINTTIEQPMADIEDQNLEASIPSQSQSSWKSKQLEVEEQNLPQASHKTTSSDNSNINSDDHDNLEPESFTSYDSDNKSLPGESNLPVLLPNLGKPMDPTAWAAISITAEIHAVNPVETTPSNKEMSNLTTTSPEISPDCPDIAESESPTQESSSSHNPTKRSPTGSTQSMLQSDKTPLNCHYCRRTFSNKSNHKAHSEICRFKTHEQNDENKCCTKCPKCGIGFRSLIRRKKHLEQGCKPVFFECEHCSMKFSKYSALKTHLNVHLGERPFKCETCGLTFTTRGNQIAHSRIHSQQKEFLCTHCDKGFHRKFALEVHLNRHNGVKPFPCTLCKKSFCDPSNLKNHRKRVHKMAN